MINSGRIINHNSILHLDILRNFLSILASTKCTFTGTSSRSTEEQDEDGSNNENL